jgi:hypothetical protein
MLVRSLGLPYSCIAGWAGMDDTETSLYEFPCLPEIAIPLT